MMMVREGGEVVRREDVIERNLLTDPAHNLQIFFMIPIIISQLAHLLVLQSLKSLILNIDPVVVAGNDLNILRVSSL